MPIKDHALWLVILVSWGIAFFEYCFQVPANRWGHGQFTTTQLKIMQEVITLAVFCVFLLLYMREPLRWNYIAGFACLIAAVVFVFAFRTEPAEAAAPATIEVRPAENELP
ncbi:MAG: DMT family protein [Planctomycetes bacterium]|nr:DMT family protein [Planctomycetota bacterium]